MKKSVKNKILYLLFGLFTIIELSGNISPFAKEIRYYTTSNLSFNKVSENKYNTYNNTILINKENYNMNNITVRLMQKSITCPEVFLPKNPAMAKRINRLIKETAEETLPTGRYKSMNIITAASEYETTINKNEILSIRFENYYYPEKMASGITTVRAITVNLITGKKYRLKDLFVSDNYQAYLNRIIQKQIEENDIPLIEEFPGITGNEVFYLSEENLVIVYQRYELTPGYYGVLEFKIPYQELIPIVSEDSPIKMILQNFS